MTEPTNDLPWPLVTTEWLGENLDAPDLRVIDCSVVMRVTDSSDAIALTALGFANVAVYDGSLSEWTSDPDLPLESD